MIRGGIPRAALIAVLVAMLMGGCSTVPTSSPTVAITEAPFRPNDDVGIEALSPQPGATPEEIVRGFIDASAGVTRGHQVAREHLIPAQAASWSDESGITVISPDYATVVSAEGRVVVTGDLVGTVDPRGVFAVADQPDYRSELTVEQVDGESRIANPPDGLLMLQPDFERIYDELAAYFLDPTGQRVVPDPRYLISGEARPTTLVERVLAGPSSSIAAAVVNPLAGATLRRAVTVSAQGMTVDLTGVSDASAATLSRLCAQLVWTLDQLPAGSVQVLVDGEPVAVEGIPELQTVDDWAAYDPGAVSVEAVGHYLAGGALRTVDGAAAPGPAGAGAYALTSAAVSADARTGVLSSMAGVSSAGGVNTLVTGRYGGELTPVLTGSALTTPTVAATRAEIWVVRDGAEVVRVPGGGAAQAVTAPTLPGLGRTTVFELSPDGVRTAAVIGGRLYVGTVVRAEDTVAVRDLRQVTPSLAQVVDVAWRNPAELLVLARGAGQERAAPHAVGVDGWGLTPVATAGLPSQPSAVAAGPSRQPLVSAGGTIWQLSGGTWVTLVRGAGPLPGEEPFYPL